MRIGIDISVLCNQWDGIGVYTMNVLKYIAQYSTEDEVYLYADRELAVDLKLGKRFHLCIDNGSNHLLWLLTKLPKYARRDHLDVFWQPNFILPFRIKGMRNIVTVHDMSAYSYSGYASTKTNITHKLFLKPTCNKADLILAISHNGAEEIIKCFPKVQNKVRTIYIGKRMFENGLDVSREDSAECLDHFGVNQGDYLLFVGTLSPRKNAAIIVNGYLQYRKQGGKKKLVLAGSIATKCKGLKKIIAESDYSKDVVVAGYISDKQKRVLYYHAAMLLFPSRLEGFGFPILEAMQAEIPVITSNVSCLPEIARDAALYLNNIDSVDEMAQCIFNVEKMDSVERQKMISRGKERVEYFDEMNYPKQVWKTLTARQ